MVERSWVQILAGDKFFPSKRIHNSTACVKIQIHVVSKMCYYFKGHFRQQGSKLGSDCGNKDPVALKGGPAVIPKCPYHQFQVYSNWLGIKKSTSWSFALH